MVQSSSQLPPLPPGTNAINVAAPRPPKTFDQILAEFDKKQRKLKKEFVKELSMSTGGSLAANALMQSDEEAKDASSSDDSSDGSSSASSSESDQEEEEEEEEEERSAADDSSDGEILPPPADPDKSSAPPSMLKKAAHTNGGPNKLTPSSKPKSKRENKEAKEAEKLKKQKLTNRKRRKKEKQTKKLRKEENSLAITESHRAVGFQRRPSGMQLVGMRADGTTSHEGEERKSSKERIRASKVEFKRLDELYNKAIHDFYLAESSQTPSGKEDKWEEYIFIVRRRFDWQNKFQKTYVDVKSAELRDILREIYKDVSGVGLREDKPTIEPNLLFNYLPQLETELSNAKSLPEPKQNPTLIQHLTLLTDYITADYSSTAKRLYPLLSHHEITFDLLWALFLPNTLVYTVCAGSNQPRCLKMDWGEEKQTMERGKYFQLDCHYVDYDGKNFGQASAVLEIDEFRGAKRIDSLGVFPLAYHEDEEEVREKLIARGRKFGNLKGMHYKFYKGLAFFKRKRGAVRVNVNGRIMVDPSTFRRINPNYRMSPVKESAGNAASAIGNDDDSEEGDEDGDDECQGGDDDDDGDINISTISNGVKPKENPLVSAALKKGMVQKPQRTYILDAEGKIKLVGAGVTAAALAAAKKKMAASKEGVKDSLVPEEMTEEELLLCSPTVLGFSFGDKLWVEFAVEHVSEINFNPNAFESLVLPQAQKTIVRALVESHTGKDGRSKVSFDDVIKGKGKGLVAVLHGRPGVGKTLTAEGISEFLQRPLYMVGAGELGTDSRTLETQLSRILDIAHIWGAVLLLDEADVFLERRSVHDLQRNALVSIFLRLLEYFQGILFLTTNRVETFDEAFQSRIHIALRYNDLDRKAKRVIWKTFLGMIAREEDGASEIRGGEGREVVNDEELEGLAKRGLNGRQIKNAVRTAQALAVNKDEKLSIKHLKLVLAVTESFEHDLKGTGQLESMMSYA